MKVSKLYIMFFISSINEQIEAYLFFLYQLNCSRRQRNKNGKKCRKLKMEIARPGTDENEEKIFNM